MKADHQKVANLVKTARGQLDGVLRMIDEDRYCMDVAQQLLAVDALLKKAYKEVLKGHMESCVKEAVEQGDPKEVISNPKEERTRQFLSRFAQH